MRAIIYPFIDSYAISFEVARKNWAAYHHLIATYTDYLNLVEEGSDRPQALAYAQELAEAMRPLTITAIQQVGHPLGYYDLEPAGLVTVPEYYIDLLERSCSHRIKIIPYESLKRDLPDQAHMGTAQSIADILMDLPPVWKIDQDFIITPTHIQTVV